MEFLALIWIGSAIFCWVVANSQSRFAGIWFLLGLVFGPIALLALAVLPKKNDVAAGPTPKTHVKCPECREFVLKDARVCKHCGCKLIPQ